jgi:hypothetical protein
VLYQLERILGRKPTPLELLDPRLDLLAALQLAECEARLDKAHARYVAVQDLDRHAELDDAQEQLNDLLYFKWIEDDTTREAARRIMKVEHLSKSYACHQKRLAGRYLREAQSSRDRALLAYLEYVGDIKFVNETNRSNKT